jgi:hypothetical protein
VWAFADVLQFDRSFATTDDPVGMVRKMHSIAGENAMAASKQNWNTEP